MTAFALEQPADSYTETAYFAGTGARLVASVQRSPHMAPWVRLAATDVTRVSLHLSRDQARQAVDELLQVLLALDLDDARVA